MHFYNIVSCSSVLENLYQVFNFLKVLLEKKFFRYFAIIGF